MLDAKAREALDGLQLFIGRGLSRAHLSADVLTLLGVALTAVAAWRVVVDDLVVGGLILIAGAVFDFFDGAVARVRGTASARGAFLDSVTDRFSDAIIFAALLWYFFVVAPDEVMAAVTLAAYATASLTPYIRAKAEALGFDCKVGILERAERLILLMVGLVLGFLEPVMWILAVLGTVTVIQRIVHVRRQRHAPA